ncbi:hypothetical protein [Nocardia barduliensis]|uniref:hypothetical protein n=1 Tax=Nocardia barduliensis TaxID=2736643 RepID=UPI0015716F09|nr:hypothetical protein [Nocardia barduliensis]
MELVEELGLPGTAVYPWTTIGDIGIGTTQTDTAAAAAAAVDGYYVAGLRVLRDALFPHATGTSASPDSSVEVITGDTGTVEKVVVERNLGPELSYRSIWTSDTADRVPLRYQLIMTTATAKATATVQFRFTDGLHPADHLTGVNVVDALRPIHEHGPGIAHRDLSITRLMPDPRL